MNRMDGRPVAVVTGAGKGIGLATSIELARKGYDLALVDLDESGATTAGKLVETHGADAIVFVGDVSSFQLAQQHSEAVFKRFGRIDALINNAGVSQPKGLLDLTEADWDRTIDVNLKSCFNWCKAVAPTMLASGGGRIVSVSSTNAVTGGGPSAVSKSAYCAAKAGILGLTRGLARELAPTIKVNAVCPGLIETDLTAGLINCRGNEMVTQIPLARVGRPEDIAVVIAFLATVEPCFMTGEIIDIDGGTWIN